ncbi:hypothetical protein [Streptomyces alboflavus]|uniref:hypothetical protein n=1 Tax=Streptomyces alboflavus TaxID=67267 RepID=UPI000B0CC98B|nr:hypothetical protein [Streptomyces alboflavus]
MDWNTATLLALAAFGLLGLLVKLLTGLLHQLPELFRALHEAKRAMREDADGDHAD